MTDKAGRVASPLTEGLCPLPAPDLQADPCSADGKQTDYYTAGTVRRLLAEERERWVRLLDSDWPADTKEERDHRRLCAVRGQRA